MMGRTHAASGWCAGLAVAPLIDAGGLGPAVTFASVTTGAALLPDIDHLEATISRALGPITRGVAWLVRGLSSAVYRATRTDRDGRGTGKHRYLTHTLCFSLLLGVLTAVLTAVGGPWAVGTVAVLAVLLAVKVLGWWVLAAATAGVLLVSVLGDLPQLLAGMELKLGIAITLGCIVHILGDWITEAPVPMLWPLKIQGRRWYPCNAPAAVRFEVNSPTEVKLVFPAFVVLGVLLVPGAFGLAVEAVTTLLDHTTTDN